MEQLMQALPDLTSFSNLVGSESLTLSGTGFVGTATPGSNKNVTLNDLSLISGTGVSSNYNLSSATLTIVQRPVNLNGTRLRRINKCICK